ncbi:MAG: hypothetical protein AAF928_15130 [Myxococcota bacterium]
MPRPTFSPRLGRRPRPRRGHHGARPARTALAQLVFALYVGAAITGLLVLTPLNALGGGDDGHGHAHDHHQGHPHGHAHGDGSSSDAGADDDRHTAKRLERVKARYEARRRRREQNRTDVRRALKKRLARRLRRSPIDAVILGELTAHAQRVATLRRIRYVAATKNDAHRVAVCDVLLADENRRHELWWRARREGEGRSPASEATP